MEPGQVLKVGRLTARGVDTLGDGRFLCRVSSATIA
jgi:hypothetical protein